MRRKRQAFQEFVHLVRLVAIFPRQVRSKIRSAGFGKAEIRDHAGRQVPDADRLGGFGAGLAPHRTPDKMALASLKFI